MLFRSSGQGSALGRSVQYGRHRIDLFPCPGRAIGKADLRQLIPFPAVPVLNRYGLARLEEGQVQIAGVAADDCLVRVHARPYLQHVFVVIIVDRVVAVAQVPDVRVVAVTSTQIVLTTSIEGVLFDKVRTRYDL